MHQQLIIDKISGILEATPDGSDKALVDMLDQAKRIFTGR
jgi:6-phospho-3-hexuloisomerase